MNSAARNTWMYSCLFFCFLAVAVPVQAAPVPVDGKYAVDYTQIVTIIKQTSGLRARVIALYLKLTHRERYTEDQIASLERKARLLCRTVKRFMETRRVGNRRRLVQASQARLNAAYRKLMSLLGEDPSSAPSGMHLISQEKPSGSMFPTASHDRPISVMVENHAKARPQTGLDKADIVYEVLVEGGITRFMAVYFDKAGVI
ncbi:MAG: DUF3048 domain-containing protein, partial [bacterium]|nr:DUF3048 domain-containing protein [bacterium]